MMMLGHHRAGFTPVTCSYSMGSVLHEEGGDVQSGSGTVQDQAGGLSDTSGDRRGEVGGWKSRHSGGFAVEIPPSLSRSSLF